MTGPLDLDDLAARVTAPDRDIAADARTRQTTLIKPPGSLGRLEELAAWIAGAQGRCPPADFMRARLVVFAGDHGVASAGVSAYPAEVTAQLVTAVRAGGTAVNALADIAGASVRLADLAVDADTPADVSTHKIRRGSGSIDQQVALTRAQTEQALLAGIAIADEEIDGGADLLIAGDIGIGNTTPAAVLIAALADEEPVNVIGRGSGIDDATWMRKISAIRDALRRARPVLENPVALLAASSGADIAAMTGFLVEAAVRRTPVLLDGLVPAAAAMVAREIAPEAVSWWLAAHRSPEPAHRIALDRLGLAPILDLDVSLGEGAGALIALPLLRAAVRTLAEMSTFSEAGITNPRALAD